MVHLPNDHPSEAAAFTDVVVHLSEIVFPHEGYSLFKRIEGYWFSPEIGEWVRDYSTHYITDIRLPKPLVADIEQLLHKVRLFALEAYQAAGRPQEEIWITSHLIDRHGALEGEGLLRQ